MENSQLSSEVEALVKRIFPQAGDNRYAMLDWVKRFLGMAENMRPAEYARVYYMIYPQKPDHLEQEGLYVNADIVAQALARLSDKEK